jgi:hypothetical protein
LQLLPFGLNPDALTDFQIVFFVLGLYSLKVICEVAGTRKILILNQLEMRDVENSGIPQI